MKDYRDEKHNKAKDKKFYATGPKKAENHTHEQCHCGNPLRNRKEIELGECAECTSQYR